MKYVYIYIYDSINDNFILEKKKITEKNWKDMSKIFFPGIYNASVKGRWGGKKKKKKEKLMC